MSDLAFIWARRTRVGSASARIVLLELAYRADVFEFICQASVEELAEACELSERTVTEAVRRLEQLGLISRRLRYDVDGKRVADEYVMELTASAAIARKPGRSRVQYSTQKTSPARLAEVAAR
jgi:DNA-binding Lrp family transcriptional regulator